MKRIFFLIYIFIFLIFTMISPASAEGESAKVMSVHYDDSSSLVYIVSKDSTGENTTEKLKFVPLSNPNRIYFDINNAVLIGEKQQLVFEKSSIKEIRLAQFSTNPNTVRAVITFEEDFDTSKVKLLSVDGNIIVKTSAPSLKNDYFNVVYDETSKQYPYSSIVANSQFVRKVAIPTKVEEKNYNGVVGEIQKAFENSTLPNVEGKSYESTVSVDISSNLKLRTKYYINRYQPQNGGLLISGIGQLTTAKMFYLNSPKRLVIDLPNTFIEKTIRNREINIFPSSTSKDNAKIGQFEYNTARIVITSEKAEKYIPIYSQDAQSLFLVESDKLDHTSLVNNVSNINKVFVKKINSKTNELILSFTSPVVYSILRTDNSLKVFLFNIKSYNEQDIIKTLSNTAYKQFTLSLLPQTGVKGELKINKNDIIKIEQSVDGKAMKFTIEEGEHSIIKNPEEEKQQTKKEKPVKKNAIKNKVVLDAGHGGTDYGAIREGINEKDITLDVTQRVDAILRSKGYKTALTRKNDVFVSLEDRVNISEDENPEVFVSIHVNSATATEPNGIETHYYHEYSKDLADIVQKRMMSEMKESKNRGLFKSKFYVINHTTVPAILCEIGFISNEAERNELITDSRKQKTAKAIAEGIIEYLKSQGKK